MQYISLVDFLLLPLYLILIYFLAKKMFHAQRQDAYRKIFFNALWLRVIGCIAYTLLVQFYYGFGDSMTYFRGTEFFTDQFSHDPGNIKYLFSSFEESSRWYISVENDPMFTGYFSLSSGNIIMRIGAVLSYISFHRFLIVSLFFAFFSFAGQWKLFLVFNDLNQKKTTKLLALVTLYSPSIWFWGSGMMKDSICLGGLGFVIYILYNMYKYKRYSAGNIISLIVLLYVITIIKPYITAILFVTLLITFFMMLLNKVQNAVFKVGILIVTLGLLSGILLQIDFSSYMADLVETSVKTIEGFQQSYQTSMDVGESQAGFQLTGIDPSLGGLLAKSPEVIFSCLYRPFLWESRKILTVFTALESTILLFITIYLLIRTRIVGFFSTIFKNESLIFCFFFSIFFALVIGYTTFNFGTMIRYKIIFLPFFYFMLLQIYAIRIQPLKNKPAATSPPVK